MNNYLSPTYELELINSGQYTRVIGIDEVGRGCFAGPVAVGAYIFTSGLMHIEGVRDSKQLSAKQREEVSGKLYSHPHKILFGSVDQIDTKGIARIIESLIDRLIEELSDGSTFFLIDGIFKKDFGSNSKKVVKGDDTYYAIAAASILAKVRRDRMMKKMDAKFNGYGFATNKGYGTKKHIEAIKRLGITEVHRKSYKPITLYVSKR